MTPHEVTTTVNYTSQPRTPLQKHITMTSHGRYEFSGHYHGQLYIQGERSLSYLVQYSGVITRSIFSQILTIDTP